MLSSAVKTARQMGYSKEFINTAFSKRRSLEAQTRQEITYFAKAEMRRQGIVRFKRWGMPEWALQIVEEACDRLRICPSEIAGPNRLFKAVQARNEVIYLIKDRKPVLSSTQLGKWFNRDHVSILYALASHASRTGLPQLCGYDIEHSRAVKRERAAQKVIERKRAA